MNINFYILFIFLSILILSCKQNSRRSLNSNSEKEQTDTLGKGIRKVWMDTLYDKNGKIEQIIRGSSNTDKHLDGRCEIYYPTGELNAVKFFYNDTAKGNFLQFYPNGKLSKFNYLTNSFRSVYSREYDTSGLLIAEKGNPVVGYDIKETKTLDTAHIQIFVSDFGFRDLKLLVAPDGLKYVKMNSKIGAVEGTKVFKMWKYTKGLSLISVYMKIIGTDSNLKQNVYFDTISIQR